ncbi:MAG: chemotaxis protein CheW [Firmicutes bacterium]|nr:chemotaxis protein CheW [Bacillota bacterium]
MSSTQVVTFRLGENYFGIEITKVKEILRLLPITKLPSSVPYICGVTNVRGKVVPVIDTLMKLNMGSIETTDETRLLLVEKAGNVVGLLVDEVSEVLNLSDDQIETAGSIDDEIAVTSGIMGIAKIDENLLTLLDTDKII